MKKIQKNLGFIMWMFAFLWIVLDSEPVRAADGTVTFGSESYIAEMNDELLVGVYIKGESQIGTYHVEIKYDNDRLEYTGGAETEEDGIIILEGTGLQNQIKYMLSFHTKSGGEAFIRIERAVVNIAESDNTESFEMVELDSADISISGEDTVGNRQEESEEENKAGEAASPFETDIPHIEPAIILEEKEYYLLDVSQYIPEEIRWDYCISDVMFLDQDVPFLTNEDRSIYFAYLIDEREQLHFYTYSWQQEQFFECNYYYDDEGTETFYYTSPYVCEQWPEGLTLDVIKKQHVYYAMNLEGKTGFYQMGAAGELVLWDEEQGKQATEEQNNKIVFMLVLAFIVIMFVLLTAYMTGQEMLRKSRRKKKFRKQPAKTKKTVQRKKEQECLEIESLDGDDLPERSTEEVWGKDEVPERPTEEIWGEADLPERFAEEVWGEAEMPEKYVAEKRETLQYEEDETDGEWNEIKQQPVISVRDVTMRFKIATSNVSGIKEYFIQLLKKQISYRELLALDRVSFNVYKGEVVGIIGTNGSGKSTLLRIVSGALNPTEGRVIVDRRKLQLLTLGTGFDMELTAKENVYLNGAIIGYTEAFINEHYDEIVKFAELEGFMEEKVKNFSSGMVSRLGFAIATVGEAAEILILDEVLSVGDEFFRKKSLARIKEMIHGGSTVLMVSHGMNTILENCSKVVWIEKGVLKMVGEPKVVCAAYQKMNEAV